MDNHENHETLQTDCQECEEQFMYYFHWYKQEQGVQDSIELMRNDRELIEDEWHHGRDALL